MPKVNETIICKNCGNTFTKSITIFKSKEREKTSEYIKENYTLCPICYRKIKEEEKKKEEEEKIKEILDIVKANNSTLVKLEGSEKQVAWAENLRYRMLYCKKDKITKEVIDKINQQTDANFWINYRYDIPEW